MKKTRKKCSVLEVGSIYILPPWPRFHDSKPFHHGEKLDCSESMEFSESMSTTEVVQYHCTRMKCQSMRCSQSFLEGLYGLAIPKEGPRLHKGSCSRLSVHQCFCAHRSLQIQEPGRRKADTTGRGDGAICAVLSLEATTNTGDWALTASNWVGPVVSLVLPNG